MNDPITIPISEINSQDTRYQYHFWKYDRKPLLRSIQAHGILTPALVEQSNNSFRIVHGFRRLECAKELGISELPVILTGGTPLENLKSALIDNRVQSNCSIYEQSKAIDIADDLEIPETTIINEIIPLLDLQPHKNVYDEYRGLIRLPDQLIEFFVEKNIPVSRTRVFQSLSEDGQAIAVQILQEFSPGINVLEELITNLYEVSRREEQPVLDVYTDLAIESILAQAEQPHIALGKLRAMLRERRYPVLTETNRTIEDKADQLHFPHCININWDRRLENRGIHLTFHWENLADVDESAEAIGEESNRHQLKEIFGKI